jgi:hypothetical protein
LILKKRRFDGLNLEGGHVACDRIVEDDIINRQKSTGWCFEQVKTRKSRKSAGLMKKKGVLRG